jgi:hypothetical protein
MVKTVTSVTSNGGSEALPVLVMQQRCVPSWPATGGAGHDSAPGSMRSRGRAVAGAQAASRRKAHHGSSRTVFHEGNG